MFSRYGRFMFAPDTGADGASATTATAWTSVNTPTTASDNAQTVDTTDYKALYEKEKADREKLKASFDKASGDIAEMKRQNKAKMSEEEQRQAEQAEREALYKSTLAQLNEIKTSSVFAKSGIAESDYSDLSKKLVETCGDKASEVAETIIELVKKSNKSAVANAKNASIVDGARTPAASTSIREEHPYADMAKDANMRTTSASEILNKYTAK